MSRAAIDPKKRGQANMQYICRQRADQKTNFKFSIPPSNDEIEILGIEVRLPDKKPTKGSEIGSMNSTPLSNKEDQYEDNALSEKYCSEQNCNINNYVCLIRFKGDEGSL